jgi:hypothetical protein
MAYIIQSYASWLPENLIISIGGEDEAITSPHVKRYLVFHHHVMEK